MNERTEEYDCNKKILLDKKVEEVRRTEDKIIDLIIQQMEVTRNQNGYTKVDFGKLLGFPYSYYSKLTTKARRAFSMTNFLTYCRLFGLDFSTIVGRSYLDNADSVLRETAIFLARLKPETLDSINKVISESYEPASAKKQADLLITHLKTVSGKPLDFYAADIFVEE